MEFTDAQKAQNIAFGEAIRVPLAALGMPWPGPVPPPTYADLLQLLSVAQLARQDEAARNVWGALDGQLYILNAIAWGWWGAYDPINHGALVALAAHDALNAIGTLECEGFNDVVLACDGP